MHALITGASAGIGKALAVAFGEAGHDLTLVSRRAEELDRVASAVPSGCRTHTIAADLTDLDRIDAVLEEAEASLGPVDVLVNNAGMQIVAQTLDVTPESGERLLTLNLLAPFRLTHAALQRMVPRGSGTIVDIASLAALAPTPGMYHYSASKAGLAAASECLRGELRRTGVHVVTVYPGPIATGMAARAIARYDDNPSKGLPVGRTDVLASMVVRAVQRRRARVIYPRSYAVTRMFPGITRFFMDRMSPLPKRLGSGDG